MQEQELLLCRKTGTRTIPLFSCMPYLKAAIVYRIAYNIDTKDLGEIGC
jgi:hypothetical protein